MNFINEVTERVTMPQVLSMYHKTGRGNRTPCPFHNGKNNNLGYNDRVYHCFVCGAKGNVITFVRDMFGLDSAGAAEKLNRDFGLGLPIGQRMTIRQRREYMEIAKRRETERREKRLEEERHQRFIDELRDEYARLDRNRILYAPKSPDEEWHPLYIEAIRKIDYQGYLIELYT